MSETGAKSVAFQLFSSIKATTMNQHDYLIHCHICTAEQTLLLFVLPLFIITSAQAP